MQVTFSVNGNIYEFSEIDDAVCRELNGEWCVRIDGQVEYIGEERPDLRMQSE